ncbi:MAG: polysaccharide lyase family protein [Terriglobia bacterium]
MGHPKNSLIFSLGFVAALLMLALPLPAAESTVWQIGAFDQSSHELNDRAPVGNPDYNPVFTVGTSTAKDWPGHQPGSENKAEGLRPHPFTIQFNLASRPKGAYRLTISTLLRNPRVPHLQVSINGKTGHYYFHPELSYYPGDSGVDSPIYAADQITIRLPTSALRAGENKLALTALDNPQDGPGDSWLTYDALRLTQDAGEKPSSAAEAAIRPTIFYVQNGEGLKEIMRVTVTLASKVRQGSMRLTVGKQSFEARLSNTPDFGEQQFTFSVPEWTGAAPAGLMLRVNGKTSRRSVSLQPERKWTLYLAPHEHLDVGFTDYRGKVAEIHDRNVDTLLHLLVEHPEMRWSIDGTWIVQRYLASRKPSAQQAFFNLVREGRIGAPAQYANLLTGYATLEEMIRSTFYGYWLHRKEGIPFNYVNITDVPSYTWSYPSILHALGIRYFAAASNNDRAPILIWGKWNTKSPFWWQGPDGSRVLMSYSRQYFQLSFMCQLPATVPACEDALPTFLEAYDRPSYKPDAALIYGTQVENTDLVSGESEFVKTWNAKYAYPKFIISTFPGYFHYIDSHFGNELPTVVGDGGPYWEDGIGTDARYAAIDRIDQQRALSAEKLSTLGAYVEENVAGEQDLIRKMWQNLILYSEHTFTSWGGYSRPKSEETHRQQSTKEQFVVNAHQEIDSIVDQAMSQLADQIHVPASTIVVFNPLSWTRSSLVETDLDDHLVIKAYPSMQAVPYEILRHGNGYNHIRFMARNVPAMGYQCYAMAEAAAGSSNVAGETSLPLSNTIENTYYRVVFDPTSGAIGSIYDKQLRKELANQSGPYRLNQYLYVSGGEGTQIVYLNKSFPVAKLTITPSSSGRVTSIRKTSYGTIMTYETSGLDAPRITTDVILFDQQKKIEFVDHLQKQPVTRKEAIYFAFPFALTHPDFKYEIQNGWVDPAHDILKGGSLDWFTVQHWVRLSGPEFSVGLVPVNAPLVSLGDINRGTWPQKFNPKSATVYSYVMNNYWHTNYFRVQGGEYTFRYVLTSGQDISPLSLARLGRASMTPMELRQVISNDKNEDPARPLSAAPESFMAVSSPNVVVEDWKAAEDGNGTVVRLLEVGGQSTTARLTFPLFHLRQVWQTNAVEQNQSQLSAEGNSVEVPVKAHQIVTLRVVGTE